jgi:hypothetical protein
MTVEPSTCSSFPIQETDEEILSDKIADFTIRESRRTLANKTKPFEVKSLVSTLSVVSRSESLASEPRRKTSPDKKLVQMMLSPDSDKCELPRKRKFQRRNSKTPAMLAGEVSTALAEIFKEGSNIEDMIDGTQDCENQTVKRMYREGL